MAKIVIQYSCGCGYKTNDFEEAVKHTDSKKHTIQVLGEIQKEN